MKKIVSRGEIKKFMLIDQIKFLEVRKSPVIEGYELEPYVVTINSLQEQFQYNSGKFYLDETNDLLNKKDIEKNQKVIKLMEEEGKSEEEIREALAGKGTDHIDRVEYKIVCEGLIQKILDAIEFIKK